MIIVSPQGGNIIHKELTGSFAWPLYEKTCHLQRCVSLKRERESKTADAPCDRSFAIFVSGQHDYFECKWTQIKGSALSCCYSHKTDTASVSMSLVGVWGRHQTELRAQRFKKASGPSLEYSCQSVRDRLCCLYTNLWNAQTPACDSNCRSNWLCADSELRLENDQQTAGSCSLRRSLFSFNLKPSHPQISQQKHKTTAP